jgi:stage V sporulation protein G
MKITEVKIYPVNEDRLKAYVTVTFDDALVVRDLKIIMGNNRLFVAMPSRRMKDGSFRDVVHPSNSDMRQELEARIFERYEEIIKQGGTTVAGAMDSSGDSSGDSEEITVVL